MTTTTAVRVISMADAERRRTEFAQAAQASGMDWAFFDGRRQCTAPLVYDAALATRRFGRALKAGEIGCYASHHALWAWFLSSGFDQLVVFEDDVIVDWPAIRQLCGESLAARGIHILKLFSTHPIRPRVLRYKLLSDHSHLVGLSGHTLGTQAYVLSRAGAQALHDACLRMAQPIDWAMSRYWDYGLPNYALVPFPVLERHGPSSIGHVPDPTLGAGAADRFARLAWRIRERLARLIADLRAPRRPFGKPADEGAALFVANQAGRSA